MTKVTLAAIVLASSAVLFAGQSEDAAYVDGTVRTIPLNARGSLDLQDLTSLQFHYGTSTYKVPYESITALEFTDKADSHFGVMTAVKVLPNLFKHNKSQYLNVSFKGEGGRATAMVLALSAKTVDKVTPALEARTGKKLTPDVPVMAETKAAAPDDGDWWGDKLWKTTRNAEAWPKTEPASSSSATASAQRQK